MKRKPKGNRKRKEEKKGTNRQNIGLISADRGTEATLIAYNTLFLFKSSTKDLSLPIFELVIRHCLLVSSIVLTE